MAGFNRNMLSMARDLRAMTQEELADGSGISQSKLSKIEGGVLQPSDDDLKAIAKALRVPVAFLCHRGPKPARGTTCIYHRKKEGARMRDLNRLYARFARLRMQIEDLWVGVKVNARHDIHQLDVDGFDGDAEKIAAIVRQTWGLPHGPVENLTATLERAGAIVARTKFECDDVSAMSFWPEGFAPVMFVNASSPGDRARFSLAHELGHLTMHAMPIGDMERQADRFASEFLMPRTSITSELSGRLTLQKLAALKPRWKVSMQALARRAWDLEIVTERQYRSLMMGFSKLGWRQSEPVKIQTEQPTVIGAVLAQHKKKGLTDRDLAGLATSLEEEFQQDFYGISVPSTGAGLRLAQ